MRKAAPVFGGLLGWLGAQFVGDRWGSAGQAVFIAAVVGIGILSAIVVNTAKLRRGQ